MYSEIFYAQSYTYGFLRALIFYFMLAREPQIYYSKKKKMHFIMMAINFNSLIPRRYDSNLCSFQTYLLN